MHTEINVADTSLSHPTSLHDMGKYELASLPRLPNVHEKRGSLVHESRK